MSVIRTSISFFCFFFSSRRRHTRFDCDWSSDVCSSDLYGFIAPHVRVLLGVSYYKADFSAAARARFEQRLKSVVIDPSADDTIRLGRITWSDVTGDVDLQYVLPQGRAVITYLGIGLGAHIRHGSGPAINGTFVQDALNSITAGLNG